MSMCANRTSPISPVAIHRFSSRYQGRNRQFSWTINRDLPSTRRTSASDSSSVGVIGFWHSTSMPRAAAASVHAACVSRGDATSSASNPPAENIASASR